MAKYTVFSNIISGSSANIASITGSLFGSSSYAATTSLAPNYVLNSATSSFVLNSQTSSFVTNSQTSSMSVASASLAATASYAPLYVLNSVTSSMLQPYVLNSATSSFVTNSQTSSMTVLSASYAFTASAASNFNVANSLTASNALINGTIIAQTLVVQTITSSIDYVTGSTRFGSLLTNTHVFTGSVNITGSLTVVGSITGDLTGSVLGTASWANNSITASYAPLYVLNSATSSFVLNSQTSSFVTNSQTSSFVQNSQTSSFVTNPQTGSFAITGSNRFVGDQIITGSLTLSSSAAIDLTIIGDQVNTGSLTVTQGITGSLFGTSSWSQNAVTSSYILNAVSASFASTSSFVNTLNQNVFILNALAIGTSSLGSGENTLVLGVPPNGIAEGEGGQLILQAPMSGSFISASMLDNYQNRLRILKGTNAGSNAEIASFNMHSKQVSFPAYNSVSAFAGTAVANLAVDSGGNILTVSTSGGTVFPYTGTAVINGGLVVTGSITASNAIHAQANGAMYFRGGDDAEFWDINVANTVGIYGQQDQTVASIKLGNNGGILSGRSGSIGIATTLPVSGTLHVNGNVFASSFTGSLFGTSSWAVSASWAPGGSGGLKTKAGSVANSSFTGNPDKATVTFSTAFDDTNYAVVITGEDARSWTIESKAVGSFVINSNSNVALTGTTYWIATAYGETI